MMMTSLNNAGLDEQTQDMGNLGGEIDKLLIAVSLTKDFKLCTFVNEDNLDDVIRSGGHFNSKGSGIIRCFNVPLLSAWVDFPFAVGRAVAQCLSEVTQEMRSEWIKKHTRPGQRVFDGREQLNGTKPLSAPDLEVESAIAKADALARRAKEMVLTAALLKDGEVRVFIRSEEARRVLEGVLSSPAMLFGCCDELGCQGQCVPCELCRASQGMSRVIALRLSEKTQQCLCS